MTTRRETERIERERVKLIALGILAAGRMPYADARAEFERRMAARGERVTVAFDDLVQAMIAEKLIDYEAGPGPAEPIMDPVALWLRPRGRARLQEEGST